MRYYGIPFRPPVKRLTVDPVSREFIGICKMSMVQLRNHLQQYVADLHLELTDHKLRPLFHDAVDEVLTLKLIFKFIGNYQVILLFCH